MQAPTIVLEPNSRGGLAIWEQPEPARKYIVASDTAAGLSAGDFATAVVVEGETCNVVARWRERDDPHVWGPKCALLAWHYNEAMLAFETGASAHGLTAHTEALASGYTRLYRRQTFDSIRKSTTEQTGWYTHQKTKPMMIDRIKKALEEGCLIPDEELLVELRDQHWSNDVVPKMESDGHDDLIMAYGIALMVRDTCWVRGMMRQEEPKPITESERYWAQEEARTRRPRPKKDKVRCG